MDTPSPRRRLRIVAGAAIAATLGTAAFGVAAPATWAADSCPNAAIRAQQGAQDLPGCRAYEQVSMADKNGAPVVRVVAPSGDGNAAVFFKTTSNPDSIGAQMNVQTVARRTALGWALTDATVPAYTSNTGSSALYAVSSDYSRMLLQSNVGLMPASAGQRWGRVGVYRFDVSARQAQLLDQEAEGVPPLSGNEFSNVVGGSSSLDTIVFTRPGSAPLLPAASTQAAGVYRDRDGVLDLVSILPDGTVADSPGVTSTVSPNSYEIVRAQGRGQLRHGVSADGRRVFFYTDFGSISDGGLLFLRDGSERTLAISESRRTGEAGQFAPAGFVGASPGGDVAYFWTQDPLTDGVDGDGVYRYEVVDGEQGELTRLTPDPGVDGLNMSSSLPSGDGTAVYFVATAALAAGATEGERNAYVWRDGQLKLVTTLAGDGKVERVSRDGRYAVLATNASLGGANTGGHRQLYVYDAVTGADPACASCRADGSANAGEASLDLYVADFVGGMPPARGIADDGRLYFMSKDTLVRADATSAPDVYVYEDGAPKLLSSGDTTGSYLGDNSDDGDTAFVFTSNRLAPQDVDDQYDLYAVRRNGGYLAQSVSTCSGESCQGLPTTPPSITTIGTIAFGGRGNVPAPGPRMSVARVRAVIGTVGALKVRLPGKGRLTVSGSGVRTTAKSVAGARTVTVRVALTAKARKALAKRKSFRTRVRLVFKPSAGSSATGRVSLRFKAPAKKKSHTTTKGAGR